jgi:copper transport protein
MEHNCLGSRNGVIARGTLPRASAVAVIALLLLPLALYAHAHLRRSEPDAHARLTAPPTTIRLWFTERPELGFTRIRLRGADSSEIPLGVITRLTDDPMGVSIPIPTTLHSGAYTVLWRTAASDGHATTGSFAFEVAADAEAAATPAIDSTRPAAGGHALVHVAPPEESSGINVSGATRWLEFMAMLAVVGAVVFRLVVLRLAARAPTPGIPIDVRTELADSARRLGQSALVLLLIAALSRLYAEGSTILGPDQKVDRTTLGMVLGTNWGHGWLVGVIGIALAAIGFAIIRYARSEAGWFVAAIGALAIVITPALTGHASAVEPIALARTADVLHVIAACAWLGALLSLLFAALPLVRGTRAMNAIGSGPLVASLVRSFHPVALTCAVVVVVSGLIAAWLRLPTISALWESAYGRVLMVKLLFVAIVAVLGAVNWRRMLPSLGDETAARRITRTAGAELTIAAIVLAVTAVLVSTPTP